MELQTRLNDDGTVHYWSVYRQQWRDVRADSIPHNDLAALTEAERSAIAAVAAGAAVRVWHCHRCGDDYMRLDDAAPHSGTPREGFCTRCGDDIIHTRNVTKPVFTVRTAAFAEHIATS
jgi:hypothetical protein